MRKPSKEIVAVLKRVRKRLSKPEAWTQGAYARRHDGFSTGTYDEAACSWCLAGAIRREVGGDSYVEGDIRLRLQAFIALNYGATNIAKINDAPQRKHEHILKWLDTVIEYDSKALGL